ncbi:preprotein translocase subunit SecE [Candidatus Dojkabacteria bacterium]|uniref:Preprotein translocase subunit SecE n=1 Tax=Candidatus Dojkabacteria bacterium TaxID=2099670 RepID=A0A955I8G2_9BACT|nr:preprotein translocase subunit SecE [Candidatus Dojkabacteria bacterium]
MQQLITNTIFSINPGNVNWGNGNGVFEFFSTWIIILVALGLIVYGVRNFRKGIDFIRDSWNELRKVEWLSRRMTYEYSIITFGVLIFFVFFILVVDELFLFVRTLLVRGS